MTQGNPSSFETKRPLVLLVGHDPKTLSSLEVVLETEGFEVQTASDGRSAWWMIRQQTPEVVVCHYLIPYMDGGELLSKIRGQERFRVLPFVMIADNPDSDEVQTHKDAATQYLLSSAPTKELLQKIQKVLRSSAPEPGLQGDLAHLALPDLLQILSQSRRTGRLEVLRRPMTFFFDFFKGELLRVSSSPFALQSKKLLFRALSQDSGDFRFHPDLPPSLPSLSPDPQLKKLDFLVMEGLRQRDEHQRLLAQLPPDSPSFRLTSNPPADRLPTPGEDALLSLLSDTKTILSLQDLLDGIPSLPDLDLLSALLELFQQKIVVVASSPPTPRPAPVALQEKRSPSRTLQTSSIWQLLYRGLLEDQEGMALRALEQALQEGLTAELFYRKLLNGVFQQLLKEQEASPSSSLSLPTLHATLDQILQRLWPLFTGRPPIQASVVLGRPVGESGDLSMIVTFLRASGFGVMDLGSRVTPSHFIETAVSSAASLLILVVRTEAGLQLTHYIRQSLDHQGLTKLPILLSGSYPSRHPQALALSQASALASDALDVARQAWLLLSPSSAF